MENTIEINKGDTVRLNSGGPLMTVSNVLSNNQLECTWFNDEDDVCIHTFDAAIVFPDQEAEWIEIEELDENHEELANEN